MCIVYINPADKNLPVRSQKEVSNCTKTHKGARIAHVSDRYVTNMQISRT